MTRMDMHVKPENMCDQHLLGNHNECHQLEGFIRSGSINKLFGHAARGQIDLTKLEKWHDVLAVEMERRSNMSHDSPLNFDLSLPIGKDSINESSTNKLYNRCEKCGN